MMLMLMLMCARAWWRCVAGGGGGGCRTWTDADDKARRHGAHTQPSLLYMRAAPRPGRRGGARREREPAGRGGVGRGLRGARVRVGTVGGMALGGGGERGAKLGACRGRRAPRKQTARQRARLLKRERAHARIN